MRVEWLDDRLTRARVVRGWWRKRQAQVYLRGVFWHFVGSDTFVGAWLDFCMDTARDRVRDLDRRRKRKADWTPLERLPTARLLK